MALITCNECDRMASDQAAAYPHCGAPIARLAATAQAQRVLVVNRSVGFWLGLGIFLSRSSLFGSSCVKDTARPAE